MALAPLAPLATLVSDRTSGNANRSARTVISAAEQEILQLPAAVVKTDGSLELYPDIQNLFRPTYHGGKPSIQCGGWIGFIPLNDAFALDVIPRVPIGNLERLVGLAAGYAPNILRYNRQFDPKAEQPQSLVDVLADQLIAAFERIWNGGLLKSYVQETNAGSFPSGRIRPFQSVLKTAKSGRPSAVSTAFRRTQDNEANRILRDAFKKRIRRYSGGTDQKQRERFLRLKRAYWSLDAASEPTIRAAVDFHKVASLIRTLSVEHAAYGDALMIAQLVLHDVGLAIRGEGNVAMLPSILINMAVVFEDYIRRTIAHELHKDARIEVKDGNRGGADGARLTLFDPVQPTIRNPTVTPDIVILVDGKPRIVIDAKYKGAPAVPDRNDINQVILYGARYEASHVMLLHAERPAGRASVEFCGKVGGYSVYNGMLDLNAPSIEDEETAFIQAVRALI